MMKPLRAGLALSLLSITLQTTAAGGEFARKLTPEEIRASGLAKLSPQELAQLEKLIEDYKAGTPSKPTAVAQSPAAPATPAAETKEAPPPRGEKKLPEWVGALITLKRSEQSPSKVEPLESRIAGDFEGWSGRTNFKLENGQVWTQVNKDDTYVYTPALKSPKVKIVPAAFGTFMMEVEGVSQRVRIRPVRLE
jgi:hypothetical protein